MILCVVGPTGVGKTRLSEELSVKYDAIVVNCDAMQVYREMNIGTAKYTQEEDKGREHFLFDIKDIDEDYTVYDYQKDLRKVLEEHENKNVVIVGGTGLYLKAGLYNYEFESRTNTKTYDEYTNEELYEMLKRLGKTQEIHINNRKRMISRLNSSGNNSLKDELLYDDVYFIGLTTSRKVLYDKINSRVDAMMSTGLLDEVDMLYKKYGPTKSLMTGIGYKELISYLEGEASLEEAIKLIKQRSRRYAKRQYTWFNHQMNIEWFDVDYENFDSTVSMVIEYIESSHN